MKKRISLILFSFISLLNISSASALDKNVLITDVLTINSSPKYSSGFTHFDYTNPNAPKKGKITLPAYGTFDNFNPYIFKGTASTETASLTLDSLAITPADDIGSAYPLIAEKFELPKDKSFVGFFINPNATERDKIAQRIIELNQERKKLGVDACGTFDYCVKCDKNKENPCSKAYWKFHYKPKKKSDK